MQWIIPSKDRPKFLRSIRRHSLLHVNAMQLRSIGVARKKCSEHEVVTSVITGRIEVGKEDFAQEVLAVSRGCDADLFEVVG